MKTTRKPGEALLRIERLSSLSRARRTEILSRSVETGESVRPLVESIVSSVRTKGDAALLRFTKKYDGVSLSAASIRVTREQIAAAYERVSREDPALMPAIRTTLRCIRAYHRYEMKRGGKRNRAWMGRVGPASWKPGLNVGQLCVPIESAGVYVPGGNAVLLTTALMAITPAKAAGVSTIVVASPPSRSGDIDPRIVVAADMAGANIIVRAGGAQAIAALAYGTASVPRVCKIVGPGNVFVSAAKAFVASSGACAIDFPAGPSEALLIADASAPVEFIARDMLAQAEHDVNACSILVTTSVRLAEAVRSRIVRLLEAGPVNAGGAAIARRSLARYGAILVADSMNDAVLFANEFAPEHLELMTARPRALLGSIVNAGGIFLGSSSPVAVGDYVCPNHILPTGGAARFASGLSVDTFLKRPSVLEAPPELARRLDRVVGILSKAEGLYAGHGMSTRARAEAPSVQKSNSATTKV